VASLRVIHAFLHALVYFLSCHVSERCKSRLKSVQPTFSVHHPNLVVTKVISAFDFLHVGSRKSQGSQRNAAAEAGNPQLHGTVAPVSC
jgi:hypothetical protein